jgi:hypothetical protein
MRRLILLMGNIGSALFALVSGAAETTELPEGPNRDLVSKVCTTCHDLQTVLDGAGFSRGDWDMSLDEMMANGMSISADDREKILGYLSIYLGPSPAKAETAH